MPINRKSGSGEVLAPSFTSTFQQFKSWNEIHIWAESRGQSSEPYICLVFWSTWHYASNKISNIHAILTKCSMGLPNVGGVTMYLHVVLHHTICHLLATSQTQLPQDTPGLASLNKQAAQNTSHTVSSFDMPCHENTKWVVWWCSTVQLPQVKIRYCTAEHKIHFHTTYTSMQHAEDKTGSSCLSLIEGKKKALQMCFITLVCQITLPTYVNRHGCSCKSYGSTSLNASWFQPSSLPCS